MKLGLLFNSHMKNTLSDHKQIGVVATFPELVNSKFQGNMNAMCWYRNLAGDFKEIVTKLELKENITEVSVEDLLALQLSEKGNLAREIILKDISTVCYQPQRLWEWAENAMKLVEK